MGVRVSLFRDDKNDPTKKYFSFSVPASMPGDVADLVMGDPSSKRKEEASTVLCQ